MKQIVFILLANFLLVNGRKLSNWADDKEDTVDLDEIKRTPQSCASNDDCGDLECCFLWTKQCYPKAGEKEACSPQSSCPCRPGLECTFIGEFPGQVFYQCLNPDIENDPPRMP